MLTALLLKALLLVLGWLDVSIVVFDFATALGTSVGWQIHVQELDVLASAGPGDHTDLV